MENKIRQAYEQGLRIHDVIVYSEDEWIKKYSETECINNYGIIEKIHGEPLIDFDTYPQDWVIYKEDAHLFKETLDTLPETLIINGIKYKRDYDN